MERPPNGSNGTAKPARLPPAKLARRLCGARKKNGGGTCPNPAMPNGRCRVHGGATPRGFANPNTKTGKYSRYLPERMLARYEEALADPELLSLKDEAALLAGAIAERLQQFGAEGSGPDWDLIVEQVEDMVDNATRWDYTRLQRECRLLSERVRAGQSEARLFEEVRSLIDQRSRLVALENRRLIDLEQMIPVEQALLLARRLAAIVATHLNEQTDPTGDLKRKIYAEFRDVMTYGAAPR